MPKQLIALRTEIEAILRECPVGSLATVGPDGTPYVVAVNYVYRSGKLYFHGALTGRKLDNIALDARVCFEAHTEERIVRASRAAEFGMRYRSVVAHGLARRITDTEEKREALIALTAKYAGGQPFTPPTDSDVAATAVVEIEIGEMTGKRNIDP